LQRAEGAVRLVFLFLLLLLTATASRADLYAGADFGVTETRALNDSRGSIGLYAGTTLSDRWAAEAGWRRVGQNPRADIASLSVLARQSLSSRWSVYGRLGVGRLSSDLPNGADAGGTKPLWGVGLHGVLAPRWAVRVDFQKVGSGTRHLGAGFMWRM
jgi:hypothetical protein